VAIFLGIDGGGSKTSCLIGDETSVLGVGTGGASNVVRVGEEQARESLSTTIRQACRVAKLEPSQISCVCVGLAGAARPEISELVKDMVSEVIAGEIKPSEIEVVGDVVAFVEVTGDVIGGAIEEPFGSCPGGRVGGNIATAKVLQSIRC